MRDHLTSKIDAVITAADLAQLLSALNRAEIELFNIEQIDEITVRIQFNAKELEKLTQITDRYGALVKILRGCPNSCGVHQIAELGFTGKKKRVNDVIEEVYELHVDGSFNEEKARLGQIFGDIIRRDIPKFICELANDLEKTNKSFVEYINSNENEFKALVKKYNC